MFYSENHEKNDVFRRQQRRAGLLRECYQKEISEPFGPLLTDSDPKTSNSSCFCSNVVDSTSTIFFLPPRLAKEAMLKNEQETTAYSEELGRRQEVEELSTTFWINMMIAQIFFFRSELWGIEENITFDVNYVLPSGKEVENLGFT